MSPDWSNQAIAFVLGILIGLLLGRLTRAMIGLVALSGAVAAALVLTGHGDILKQNADVLPSALALGGRVAAAVKEVLMGTPAALLGSLCGIVLRELVRLVKS